MKYSELMELYEKAKEKYGKDAYRHISEILSNAKEVHKKDFLNSEAAKIALSEGRTPDSEQSWKPFKGHALEALILHILEDEVKSLGLKIINGNALEKTNNGNLSDELNAVKRNLLVNYGEFGYHLPDVDMVIYEPKTQKIIAVLSSKVTLRERIAQTGYWKIKLAGDSATRHIKVFFITPDEDGTLTQKKPAKKGRAIVEIDTDGSYVLSEINVEESKKVKMLDKFLDDLKNLMK